MTRRNFSYAKTGALVVVLSALTTSLSGCFSPYFNAEPTRASFEEAAASLRVDGRAPVDTGPTCTSITLGCTKSAASAVFESPVDLPEEITGESIVENCKATLNALVQLTGAADEASIPVTGWDSSEKFTVSGYLAKCADGHPGWLKTETNLKPNGQKAALLASALEPYEYYGQTPGKWAIQILIMPEAEANDTPLGGSSS